jgi:hypothetical protein
MMISIRLVVKVNNILSGNLLSFGLSGGEIAQAAKNTLHPLSWSR